MADLCLADPLVDRFCWLRCICNSMGNGCSGRYETFMTNRQWCWNDAFKFARWQHCAVELWARFAMHSTTCEEVFTKCMRLHYLYSLLSIGGLWRQTVGDDCSEFHPLIFFFVRCTFVASAVPYHLAPTGSQKFRGAGARPPKLQFFEG